MAIFKFANFLVYQRVPSTSIGSSPIPNLGGETFRQFQHCSMLVQPAASSNIWGFPSMGYPRMDGFC